MTRAEIIMWAMATCAVWQLFWRHIEDKDKFLELVMAPILAVWICVILLMDFYDKKKLFAVLG